jgi:KaiC/GvpD/RAD55 family RecA-like ATPase
MMPNQQMGGMPGMMPNQMGMGGNPMMQMMQMMQMMMGNQMGAPTVDPSAMPFANPMANAVADGDEGLDADIIRPATFTELLRTQEAVQTGSVLDRLVLKEDGSALGGIPKGCTMAFVGPPGKGKTRTALALLARAAKAGMKVAFVVAEEGFHDSDGSGRDDLCSRMVKVGQIATGIDDVEAFRTEVLERIYVLESQYHKGQTWDDFISKYRYLVEKAEIDLVVIDSLNMLDPTKHRTADNLSALKTYNHEQGVTCLCIGQIKDTGLPVGGEALMHTADAVFLIEQLSLTSKDMAAQWGGNYRDKIDVIRAVKSVTTPTFPHLVRIQQAEGSGALEMHEAQPEEFAPPALD